MLGKRLFGAILALTILGGCSSKPDPIEQAQARSPQALYNEAKGILDSGLYSRAIELYTQLDSRFPFGPIAKQVQLDLILAYYQSGQSEKAITTIDRFIRLNPNHADLDFAYYMRGLVNIKADENGFQEFFGIDRADRDIARARQAFTDLKTLVDTYPNSEYKDKAQQLMVWLLNKMARHELKIAEYYMERGAHLAAANRAKYVVENYSHSPYVKDALSLMVNAYNELGLKDLAADAKATLSNTFASE